MQQLVVVIIIERLWGSGSKRRTAAELSYLSMLSITQVGDTGHQAINIRAFRINSILLH